MDMTVFLAQLWGPTLLAVGLGIFVSRSYYVRLYRDLDKETLAVLLLGILGIVGGIVHIQAHSAWETLPQIVVSLLGWGLLLKGATFAIAPNFVDRMGDRVANSKLLPLVGTCVLILGGYLSWIGYFS